MTQETTADIVVIGGGPAGSAASTMLVRQGWRVVLLEREYFPRDHVGESLLPASIPILEELGVLPAVEAQGFLKKLGATMVWGRDKEPWSWFFGETNRRYPHSYQVWRPTFDHLLLDNAATNGVDVSPRLARYRGLVRRRCHAYREPRPFQPATLAIRPATPSFRRRPESRHL